MENKIKSFGYVRKSPDEKEGTESSIFNQTKLIEEYAKNNNFELIEIFIDKNISGSDRTRKAFNDMISRAIHGEAQLIIIKDQDRFARDTAFFSDTLTDLEAYGVKVFSIIKNDYISAEDLGDMVTSVVDADFVRRARAKTKISFEQKKNEGLPPFIAPFGYKFSKTKPKIWIFDKKNAEIVKIVCCDVISGVNYKETIEKSKINKSLYYRILKNASAGIYSGYIVYQKKIKASNKTIVRFEEIKYKGIHKPIISDEIFHKVQDIIKSRRKA
jgi:DNA invertase Pin-like site-specific DNA recombinase